MPVDLRGQTLLLIGVGAVGTVFAGYARAFGLKVIGVRRSPLKSGDPVDELHPPSRLPELLPRGEVVDAEALIEAVRSGHLAGAALDAHRQEPLAADSSLWDLPNVIITPHNASASTGNEKRCAEMFIANFGRRLHGEPMFNVQRVT